MSTTGPLPNLKTADKTVMGVIAAIVAVPAIYALTIVVPILLKLAVDMTYLAIMCVVLALIGMVIADKGFWTAVYYKWANISRGLRRSVARENPIGTMDTAIARFGRKLVEVDENRTIANAALKRHANKIAEFTGKAESEEAMVIEAQRQRKPDLEIKRHATYAERWRKASAELEPMGVKFLEMAEKLTLARELADNSLEDMKNQREVYAAKYDVIMSNQKAAKRLMNFFGQNEDLEMLRLGVEAYEIQTTEAEADIDMFIANITPAIETNDLKKQAEAQRALDRLTIRLSGASQASLPPAVEVEVIEPVKQKANLTAFRR